MASTVCCGSLRAAGALWDDRGSLSGLAGREQKLLRSHLKLAFLKLMFIAMTSGFLSENPATSLSYFGVILVYILFGFVSKSIKKLFRKPLFPD